MSLFFCFLSCCQKRRSKALLVFFLFITIAPDRLAMIDSILTNREEDDDTLAEHLFEHVMPWHLREKYVLTRLSHLDVRLFRRKSSFLRRIHFDHQLTSLPFGPSSHKWTFGVLSFSFSIRWWLASSEYSYPRAVVVLWRKSNSPCGIQHKWRSRIIDPPQCHKFVWTGCSSSAWLRPRPLPHQQQTSCDNAPDSMHL